MISEEVVNAIINELSTQGYYSIEDKQVTENGRNYIEKKEIGEFQEEKVFGKGEQDHSLGILLSLIGKDTTPVGLTISESWKKSVETKLLLLKGTPEVHDKLDAEQCSGMRIMLLGMHVHNMQVNQ